MPRYYFDICDATTTRDDIGVDLNGEDAARDEAARTLGEIAKYALPGNAAHEIAIVVSDNDKRPLFEASLRFAIQPLR